MLISVNCLLTSTEDALSSPTLELVSPTAGLLHGLLQRPRDAGRDVAELVLSGPSEAPGGRVRVRVATLVVVLDPAKSAENRIRDDDFVFIQSYLCSCCSSNHPSA